MRHRTQAEHVGKSALKHQAMAFFAIGPKCLVATLMNVVVNPADSMSQLIQRRDDIASNRQRPSVDRTDHRHMQLASGFRSHDAAKARLQSLMNITVQTCGRPIGKEPQWGG